MGRMYRVWMVGGPVPARHDGYVEIYAKDEENAEYKAKRVLTRSGGTFSDWRPSMFRVTKIERI